MTDTKMGGSFSRSAKGIVINIDDPYQMGRCQVNWYGYCDGLSSKETPWSYLTHGGGDNTALNGQGKGPHLMRIGTTVHGGFGDTDAQIPEIYGTITKGGNTDDSGKAQPDSDIPQAAKEQTKQGPGGSVQQPRSGDVFPNSQSQPGPDGATGNPGTPDTKGMSTIEFGRKHGPAERDKACAFDSHKDSIGHDYSPSTIPLGKLCDELDSRGNKSGAIRDACRILKGNDLKEKIKACFSDDKQHKAGDPPLPPTKKGHSRLEKDDVGKFGDQAANQDSLDALQNSTNDNGDQPYSDMQDGAYNPGNGSDEPGVPTSPDEGSDDTPIADNNNFGDSTNMHFAMNRITGDSS
jgi:hypothetical protein